MKMLFHRVLPIFLVIVAFALPAAAQTASAPSSPAIFMNAEQGDLKALDTLRYAAEGGLADAQYKMGLLDASGRGLPQNYEEAYFWFSLAAKAGVPEADVARDEAGSHLQLSQALAVKERVAKWHPLTPPSHMNH